MSEAYQINLLGQQIGEALAAPGKRRLEDAQLGLQEKRLDADLAMKALQRPALQLGAAQAKQKLDALNKPLSAHDLYPDGGLNGLEHSIHEPKDGRGSILDRSLKLMGATYDTTPGSPTRGRIMRDGKPMTFGDFSPYAPQVLRMYTVEADPYRIRRAEFEAAEARGDTAAMEQHRAYLEDPARRLEDLQRRRDYLSRFSGMDAKSGIERLNKQIERMQKQVDDAAVRKDERAYKARTRKEDQAIRRTERAEDAKVRAQERSEDRSWDQEKFTRGREPKETLGGVYVFQNGAQARTPSELKAMWELYGPREGGSDWVEPKVVQMTPEAMQGVGVRFVPSGTDPKTAAQASAPGSSAGGPSARFKVDGGRVQEPRQQGQGQPQGTRQVIRNKRTGEERFGIFDQNGNLLRVE